MKLFKDTKKTTALLLLNTLILSGCENSNYATRPCDLNNPTQGDADCSSPNPTPTKATPEQLPDSYVENDGVGGKVLGEEYWIDAEVCFDTNLNGQCDEEEPTTKTYGSGQFSFKANSIIGSITNKTPLLAINTSQTSEPIALYAPAPLTASDKGVHITPYTTLVVSETIYNPYTLHSVTLARTALTEGAFVLGDIETLSGKDYLDNASTNNTEVNTTTAAILSSLSQAQALSPSNHYNATAAMLDAMYKQNSHTTNLSADEVNTKKGLDNNVNATLASSSIGWALDHQDEVSSAIHAQTNIAVVGSKWHNRLVVLDITETSPSILSLNLFAESPNGEKDGPVDAVTGATEQTMKEVIVTPDENNIMVAIAKYEKDKAGLGVGLYKADASNKSEIPNKRFAADAGSDSFYAFPGLTDAALSQDGSRIALSGEDKKAVVLETSTFSEVQTFSFNSKARSIALNADGSTAYVSLYVPQVGLMALNVTTGEEMGFFETGFEYPVNLKMLGANKAAWHLRDSKTLSIYNIEDFSLAPALLKTIESDQTIKHFDISDDEQFAIIAIGGGIANLYGLDGEVKLIKSFNTEKDEEGVNKPINSLSFTKAHSTNSSALDAPPSNTNRVLISVKNAIQVLDISSNPPKDWTEEQKQLWFDQNRKP